MSEKEWVSGEETDCALQATLEGRCEDALRMWDSIIQRTGEVTAFNVNRGVTRLLCGDTQGALADFRAFRSRSTKVALPFAGAALWLLGQREAACEDWVNEISRRRAGEITHTDEGSGVEVPALLWWASAHEGLEGWRKLATQELKDRDRYNRRRKDYHPALLPRWARWPGVLAPFLAGDSSEEALLPVMQDLSPFMAVRRCPAHFYLGARRLDAGDLAGYRRELELAVGQGGNSVLAPQYHLARAELTCLDQ